MVLVRLSNLLAGFVAFLGRAAGILAVSLMLVIVADVVLRRWFVIGSTQLQELEWHLHGGLFLLAMGWAYVTDRHVRIEVLSERWKPRTRAWVELMGIAFLLAPYTAALLWFGWDYFMISLANDEASASPSGLPARYIIKGIMVFGIGLLGIAALSRALDVLIYLFGPVAERGRTRFFRNMVEPHRGETS